MLDFLREPALQGIGVLISITVLLFNVLFRVFPELEKKLPTLLGRIVKNFAFLLLLAFSTGILIGNALGNRQLEKANAKNKEFETILAEKDSEIISLQQKIESLSVELEQQTSNTINSQEISVYSRNAGTTNTDLSIDEGKTFKLNNISYELVEAVHDKDTITFYFIAFNEGSKKDVCVFFSSSLIDSLGNEHQQSERIGGGISSDWGDCLSFTIPHKVPTRFGLKFINLPIDVTNIPYLTVVLQGEGVLEFRDIPIPYSEN